MLQTKKEIIDWLEKHGIDKFNINEDLSIDVENSVSLCNKNLKSIEVQFSRVLGNFDCSDNDLASLNGCPSYVGGMFLCYKNNLQSLDGGPNKIDGMIDCHGNKLVNLLGGPKEVGSHFNCSDNKLVSLEGCPKVILGSLDCRFNCLETLDFFPKLIQDKIRLSGNELLGVWQNFNTFEEIKKTLKIINSRNELNKVLKPTVLDSVKTENYKI